jgi:polysaccharide deacetylase 2 family uncharacterized protein YibQ
MAERKNSNGRPSAAKRTSGKRAPQRKRTTPKKKTEAQKKQLTILGGVLAAVIVLFIGMLIGMSAAKKDSKANIPLKTPLESVQEEVVTKDNASATLEDADRALKLTMFNLGIPAETIKSRQLTEGSVQVVTYEMILDEKDKSKLTDEYALKLKDMGFEVTGENGFSASNGAAVVILGFAEPEPVKEPTVVKSKRPVLPANAPKMAIIIDDCGYNLDLAKTLSSVDFPLTFAIIPYTAHDSETAELVHKKGQAVFLHFPMEPLSYPKTDPGKGAVLLNMPASIIEAQVNANVKRLGKIDGFNNHMGSAFTENKKKMTQVLTFMKPYTNVYIDSYTSGKSVAFDTCKELGLKCGQNRKFIDNDSNPQYILGKIRDGISLAKKNGSLIMIGHLRDSTVDVLEKHLIDIEKAGVKVVPVQELLTN